MARTPDLKKEQFWKTHIAQAEYFNGGINKYCEKEGIQVHSFKYWKTRLAKDFTTTRFSDPSSFIPVKVVTAESSRTHKSLPDPKWLAELICALHARLQ